MALGGGSVRRGWHHLGWLWRLGSSSESVKMEHSWALSAIGDVVGTGHLAWGKGGGGLGRDLLGEAMDGGRGISAGHSGIQGLMGTDSTKWGILTQHYSFSFAQGRSRHLLGCSFRLHSVAGRCERR